MKEEALCGLAFGCRRGTPAMQAEKQPSGNHKCIAWFLSGRGCLAQLMESDLSPWRPLRVWREMLTTAKKNVWFDSPFLLSALKTLLSLRIGGTDFPSALHFISIQSLHMQSWPCSPPHHVLYHLLQEGDNKRLTQMVEKVALKYKSRDRPSSFCSVLWKGTCLEVISCIPLEWAGVVLSRQWKKKESLLKEPSSHTCECIP